MNRREFLKQTGIGGVLIGCSGDFGFGQSRKQEKPNIVFIIVADMGWANLGCYGDDDDGGSTRGRGAGSVRGIVDRPQDHRIFLFG